MRFLLDANAVLKRYVSEPGSVIVTKVLDRKSTRLNSSHRCISYAVFCFTDLPSPHSFPTRRSSDLKGAGRRPLRIQRHPTPPDPTGSFTDGDGPESAGAPP